MVNGEWRTGAIICPHSPSAIHHSTFSSRRDRLGVLASHGFDDQARLDGLGADLDSHNLPIDDRAHLLDVRPKLASGDSRDLGSHAAQVLRLAAMGDLVAEGGLLTG